MQLATQPEANIIKLPNVSASVPQLKAAVKELQEQGYDLPDYPENPKTDEDNDIRARYGKVMGSAVNPVLREGNSDRRAPASVKAYARAHPHRMGAWSADSKTNVATMGKDDFRSNEQSVVIEADDTLRIEHVAADGTVTVLKESIPVLAGEVVDGTYMNVAALRRFLDRADRAGQGRGRAVLGAPQGHDDEGLRPDHLRPRRPGLLPDPVRAVRRRAEDRGHLAQRRARRAALRGRGAARGRRDQGRRRSRGSTTARTWRWSTPTRASPTCTSPPT